MFCRHIRGDGHAPDTSYSGKLPQVLQAKRPKTFQNDSTLSASFQDFSSLPSLIALDRLIATQAVFSTVSSQKTAAVSKLRNSSDAILTKCPAAVLFDFETPVAANRF
jgi:hypothetical protein